MNNTNLTLEEFEAIVKKLNASAIEIEKVWNSIKSTELEKIKASWVGKDCEAYTSKLASMDADVKKALQAQRTLADTFNKAKTKVADTQDVIANKIANI